MRVNGADYTGNDRPRVLDGVRRGVSAAVGILLLILSAQLMIWVLPTLQGEELLRAKTLWPVCAAALGAFLLWVTIRPSAAPKQNSSGLKLELFSRTRGARGMPQSGYPHILFLASVGIGLALRLVSLRAMPPFLDEAAFVVLARMARDGHPWYGLQHGGKLLFIWLSAIVTPILSDPVLSARLVSALVGVTGIAATYLLGRLLYGRQAGTMAGLFYAIIPFAVFNDRLGTMDGTLSALVAACLAVSIACWMRPTRDLALLEGTLMGLAALAKVPGLFVLFFPLWVRLCLRPGHSHDAPSGLWLCRYAPALILAGPSAWSLHRGFVWSFTSLSGGNSEGPLSMWARNGRWLVEWIGIYWTVPVVLLGLVAVAVGVARGDGRVFLLMGASVVPILAFALVARLWFPRYLLFAAAPWLVLSAEGLNWAGLWLDGRVWAPPVRTGLLLAGGILVCVPAVRFDLLLVRDPLMAPLPAIDRWQYVEGWPSGYGLREAIDFLRPEIDHSLDELAVAVDKERSEYFIFGLSIFGKKLSPLTIDLIDRTLPRSPASEPEPGNGLAGGRLAVHAFDLKDPSTVPTLRTLAERRRVYVLLSYDGADPYAAGQAAVPAQPLSREHSVLQQAGARRLRTFSKPGGFSHYEVWGIGRTAE